MNVTRAQQTKETGLDLGNKEPITDAKRTMNIDHYEWLDHIR